MICRCCGNPIEKIRGVQTGSQQYCINCSVEHIRYNSEMNSLRKRLKNAQRGNDLRKWELKDYVLCVEKLLKSNQLTKKVRLVVRHVLKFMLMFLNMFIEN